MTNSTTLDIVTDNAQENQRKNRVMRAVTAWMAWHSGKLAEYGITKEYVDNKGEQVIEDYISEDVSRRRAITALSFDTYFSRVGSEIVCMDRAVLQRALHLPHPNSQEVINLPVPLTILVGQPGTAQSEIVVFTDYSDFRNAYMDLGLCITNLPNVVLNVIDAQMWKEFGSRINADMAVRLDIHGHNFAPPEIRMSGVEQEMTIEEIICSQQLDGRLVKVVGQVAEMGDVRKRGVKIKYRCMVNNCGNLSADIYPDYFEETELKPSRCSCGAGDAGQARTQWVMAGPPDSSYITFQRLMIRQTNTQMTSPPYLLVEVRGTQVHTMNQGEDVVITGVYGEYSEKVGGKKESMPILHATDLTRTSQDSVVEVTAAERDALVAWKEEKSLEELFELMMTATAPTVIGHNVEKKALLLQSIGSYPNLPDDKRPFIHIMFIGDPGTAKSQLMNFACRNSNMHPGCSIATGARTSIPGLIGGKSEHQRLLGSSRSTLQPGMLALIPPGGVAGIDELHALGKNDDVFTALNDAMETGQVSVQMQMKGTIQTRTPILACANPKSGANSRFARGGTTPLIEQAGLPVSFVSRFDLIFCFFDRQDEGKDRKIIQGMTAGANVSNLDLNSLFPVSVSRGYLKYLQLCRDIRPADEVFSEKANEHLANIFVATRKTRTNDATVNFRWGAALRRLSCAVARLDLSSVVTTNHIDLAHDILIESLTTREPAMAQEGHDNSSSTQTKWYDIVYDIVRDWYLNQPDGDWHHKNDAYKYVEEHFESDDADLSCPTKNEFYEMLAKWKRNGTIEFSGEKITLKGI